MLFDTERSGVQREREPSERYSVIRKGPGHEFSQRMRSEDDEEHRERCTGRTEAEKSNTSALTLLCPAIIYRGYKTHYEICDTILPIVQNNAESTTDLKVMTGNVGSSSKLTVFLTISGIFLNSSDSQSY